MILITMPSYASSKCTSIDGVKAALLGANQYLLQLHFPISFCKQLLSALLNHLHGYMGKSMLLLGVTDLLAWVSTQRDAGFLNEANMGY